MGPSLRGAGSPGYRLYGQAQQECCRPGHTARARPYAQDIGVTMSEPKTVKHRRLPGGTWLDIPAAMTLKLVNRKSTDYPKGWIDHPLPKGVVVQRDPDAKTFKLPANVEVRWLVEEDNGAEDITVMPAEPTPIPHNSATALSVASEVLAIELARLKDISVERPLSYRERNAWKDYSNALRKQIQSEQELSNGGQQAPLQISANDLDNLVNLAITQYRGKQ